jgi:DNA repair protein RecN (Recombination protein N)
MPDFPARQHRTCACAAGGRLLCSATVTTMLVTLRVKNLALVESARVDFQPGLNVITGETGAGKSILVGALALLLGERADRRLIRAGADACGAEALFHLPGHPAVSALLEELGVPAMEDDQLIVRRIVKADGPGQNLINDTPVTAQALKRLGEMVLDMHGPHEHQSLLHPDRQLGILDAFARADEARAKCAEAFAAIQAIRDERAALEGAGADLEAQLDLLRHRVREIEEAAPVEGEDERIEEEQRVAGSAQRLLELGSAVVASLTEGEANAFDRLAESQRNLEEMARLMPQADAWRQEILQLAQQVREIAAGLQSSLESVEANPERLQWLDQRLATYQRLKKKYGGTVPGILAVLEESRARLRGLESREDRLRELAAAETKGWAAYRTQAEALRAWPASWQLP